MAIFLAEKTLKLIDEKLASDSGAAFRKQLQILLPKMDDAYRGEEPPFRQHLGASQIGRECAQELWLQYHWATIPSFEPKILRLFNRGHCEEARFLALLAITGIQLWYETEDGGQIKFSDWHKHFGSALDGIAKGIPDIDPSIPVYSEFKTHNEKSFTKLAGSLETIKGIRQRTEPGGVLATKKEHYVQCQICMHNMQLPATIYIAVNKNTDELYAEIFNYDPGFAASYTERAGKIIFSSEALPKISQRKSWWECKFCNQKEVCHGNTAPEINCRTCCHSTPSTVGDGSWSCALSQPEILQEETQFTGCGQHVYNPHMLNKVQYHGPGQNGSIDITLQDGERILQGPNHTTSQQLKERGL